MNYHIIKKIPITLFIISGLFLNITFVHAEDIILQSKQHSHNYINSYLYNYNIGYEGGRHLSEIVPLDYDNTLEKIAKKSDFINKNMIINNIINATGVVTTYHNPPGLDYTDFHSIIDNELALHSNSLGLIAAYDQISPLEWEDKVKQLSTKGMDHLSYAEKFDLALCLEYDDARVKRSEPISDRLKKADEILTNLWKEDKLPIIWCTRFGLYQTIMFQNITDGAPFLKTEQEFYKKESILDNELIDFAAGDTVLASTKKAELNGWKNGPVSTYSLSKSQLKYLLQAVKGKANVIKGLILEHSKTYPEYLYNGKFDGYGGAEYAYWQRWIKQIESQLKEGNAAK